MNRSITLIVGIIIGILAALSFTEMASETKVHKTSLMSSIIEDKKKSRNHLRPMRLPARLWRFLHPLPEQRRDEQSTKTKSPDHENGL
jgi:hypothetical protein